MQQCLYEARRACPNEPVINFRYCTEHLNTPRGAQHMIDVARSGAMLVQSDVDSAIQERTKILDKDVQTTALEKMLDALERVLAFERHTEKMISGLPSDEWRFLDRTGSEQLRSEVQIYERAMERTARVLKDISKMAIQEKMVSLGKAQTDLIVRILMSTVTEMELDEAQIEAARQILLRKFLTEANLAGRTQKEVVKELTAPYQEVIDVDL